MLTGQIFREGPGWSAHCTILGAFTQGRSLKEAIANLAEAIELKVGERDFKVTITEIRRGGSDEHMVFVEASEPALLAAEVLKYQREVHRLSLADVAKKLGAASVNAYAAYEQGKREPSLSKFLKLLHAVAPEVALVVEPRDAAKLRKRKEEWLRVVNGLRTQEFRAHGVTAELKHGAVLELLIRVGRTKTATTSLAWSAATGFIAQGIDPDATSNMVLGRMRKVVGL